MSNQGEGMAQPYSVEVHDALIIGLRHGRYDDTEVLAHIRRWLAQPLTQDIEHRLCADGIVIAQRLGQNAEAIELARRASVRRLPDYALMPAFRAARAIGDRSVQARAVQRLRMRQPDAWQPRVMEVLWLTDVGAFVQAQTKLDALEASVHRPSPDQRVELLEARGALNEARGRHIEAIGDYIDLLSVRPDHPYAARERVFLLAHTTPVAALQQALRQEGEQDGRFSPMELARLRQQSLGQQVRWAIGERDQLYGYGEARFAALDEVLARYDRILPAMQAEARVYAQAHPHDTEAANAWHQVLLDTEYDHIVALSGRGRHNAVLQAYGSLVARGESPPYYVLSAAARAHQQLRRSDLAVPLYEAALRDGEDAIPLPSDTHIGLVYAYIDTARFEEAEALLQTLEAATPPLLRLSPIQGQANTQYSQIRHLRALTQLYTDHPARAERSFDALLSMAPLNAGFRSGQAETAALREKPEQALAYYEEALTDNPDDTAIRAGYASALVGAGHVREGRLLAAQLQREAPESIEARRSARDNRIARAARLEVRAEAARDGGALANREWRVDSRLTSGLIDDQWRVYGRQVLGTADLDDSSERLVRTGLGFQWQRGRWTAGGEVHRASHGRYRAGVAGEVTYRASDAWRLSADVDTDSLDTPYKARRNGIGARAVSVTAAYIVNEARSFNATYRHMDYSDGNQRNAVGAGWRERWLTGPRWQFETTLDAETGANSKSDTPYFSPRNETAVLAGARTQYLTWKRDNRRMLQVLEGGVGAYRQSGQGTGPLWSLAYAHEWIFGNGYQISYGVGIASHPYDGVNEKRRNVFLTLSVPLQ